MQNKMKAAYTVLGGFLEISSFNIFFWVLEGRKNKYLQFLLASKMDTSYTAVCFPALPHWSHWLIDLVYMNVKLTIPLALLTNINVCFDEVRGNNIII